MIGRPLRYVITVGKAIAAAHVFTNYCFNWGPASGASMLPTFDIQGDHIIIDRRYRFGRNIVVGDLVNYRIPIFRHSEGVKRVLGMPGDYVLVGSPDAHSHQMIQVPQGHCWLVGDNLDASRDSRIFGPVPLALVKGKVVAKFLPLSNRRIFRNELDPEDGSGIGRQR
ncbi:mitochondrial inner membrane protease subunit [Colletotrichum truncatum]|uniref:Mitochondrial inner membrane protease subunit n=1 Tax=Colletotrichum truncatum TaxID=5467 RepID=A0ACC3ZHY0_COLTU|nr:mitochondrial inner membrane protease subunit [Colletotrichum truncatum]KAF6786742.1 mitochondrial inner membrane protease subunit [Colletotrichum truncatum]